MHSMVIWYKEAERAAVRHKLHGCELSEYYGADCYQCDPLLSLLDGEPVEYADEFFEALKRYEAGTARYRRMVQLLAKYEGRAECDAEFRRIEVPNEAQDIPF